MEKLRIRAEVYCGKGVPEEAQLFELGWTTKEVVREPLKGDYSSS